MPRGSAESGPVWQEYKKVMKDLEALKAATKPDKAKEVYAKARVSMNGYLEEVELPPLGDQRYAL